MICSDAPGWLDGLYDNRRDYQYGGDWQRPESDSASRFDHGVVAPDFPSDPLSLFVYLIRDRRLLATEHVLIGAASDIILIDRKRRRAR
jgi:hypothetical protein